MEQKHITVAVRDFHGPVDGVLDIRCAFLQGNWEWLIKTEYEIENSTNADEIEKMKKGKCKNLKEDCDLKFVTRKKIE